MASKSHLVPGMAVKTLLEALLIQCMANETNGARQHEQAIEVANLDDVLDLGLRRIPSHSAFWSMIGRHRSTSKREMQSNNPTTCTCGSPSTDPPAGQPICQTAWHNHDSAWQEPNKPGAQMS